MVRNKSKSWPPAMHTGKPELYICLNGGSQASLWGWARGLHLLNTHPLPSACSEGLALRLPPHVSSDYTKKKQSFLFLHSFHTYWLHHLLGPKNILYLIVYYLSLLYVFLLSLGLCGAQGQPLLFPNLIQQLTHSNTKSKNDYFTDCPHSWKDLCLSALFKPVSLWPMIIQQEATYP